MSRTALRRSASYGGHPSQSLRSFFALQKKTTNGNPDGLPSAALAKDGGDGGS